MTIDLIAIAGWVCLGFSIGVLFCELTRVPKPKQPARRLPRRLSDNFWVSADGRIYLVRCRPRAFERLCNRIEDESCQGKP